MNWREDKTQVASCHHDHISWDIYIDDKVSIKYSTYFILLLELLACVSSILIVMLIMATISHQKMKRCYFDDNITFPISKAFKRIRDYQEEQQLFKHDWSLEHRKKIRRINEKDDEQQYHCQVYLKLFPSTLKCSLDVIVTTTNKLTNETDDVDSILIAKTRIPKIIKPGRIHN